MNQSIPWLDLTRQHARLKPVLLPVLDGITTRSGFLLGPAVEQFEAEFADFVGGRHCVGLNSGTSALHLALLACGVGPGDEVITVPASWISTTWAISRVGARPVYVDIDPLSCCIDPTQVEDAITSRTRAILPVHLYGQVADVPAIGAIARRHGLAVIEDACQAHASTRNGRHAGTFGQVGCFSFYPGKNLGACGEAGAIVTDDPAIAEHVRRLRDHPRPGPQVPNEIGFGMRMERIQAAVLSIKLRYLTEWTEARRRVAIRYEGGLHGVAGLILPFTDPAVRPCWHIYGIRADDRDALRSFLADHGIQTSIHYPTPVHLQTAYQHLGYRPGDFPAAEALCQTQVTLPMFPELTDAELDRVIDAVSRWSEIHHSLRSAA